MAIYRLSAQLVKRSAGRSATAAAAYRAGIRIVDERTGLVFDYRRRHDVGHTEILAPPHAPDRMRDRVRLWNTVEFIEKRKDAQLARELQLALPHELTAQQRLELLRQFVLAEFVARGMVADLAIHHPDRRGDPRNHHAHVMLTLRNIADGTFGMKAREWNDVSMLEGWRSAWSDAVNRALARHGHAARIEHRSYIDQGIDCEPEPKVGPVATKIERLGRPSRAGADRRAVRERNRRRAAHVVKHPERIPAMTETAGQVAAPASDLPGNQPSSATLLIAVSLAAVPAHADAPCPVPQRLPVSLKRHLLNLWATVARALTLPVRFLAAATKRRRRRHPGLLR